MTGLTIDQLLGLAFNGTTIMVRALALAKLSKVDPELFKKIRDIVNNETPSEAFSEDGE